MAHAQLAQRALRPWLVHAARRPLPKGAPETGRWPKGPKGKASFVSHCSVAQLNPLAVYIRYHPFTLFLVGRVPLLKYTTGKKNKKQNGSDLLVFPFWSILGGGAKRLTFYFRVLWASETKMAPDRGPLRTLPSIEKAWSPGEASGMRVQTLDQC